MKRAIVCLIMIILTCEALSAMKPQNRHFDTESTELAELLARYQMQEIDFPESDIKRLVIAGADPDAINAGQTWIENCMSSIIRFKELKQPLQHDMVLFLLDHGANPNLGPNFDAFLISLYHSITDIAARFIERGVNLAAKDELDKTPLHHATSKRIHPELVKLLLESGAAITLGLSDDAGETPISSAHRKRDSPHKFLSNKQEKQYQEKIVLLETYQKQKLA